jgi:hypothetical protein
MNLVITINRVINFYSNVYYLFAFVIIYSNVYYLFGKNFYEFLNNLKMYFEINKKIKPSLTLRPTKGPST